MKNKFLSILLIVLLHLCVQGLPAQTRTGVNVKVKNDQGQTETLSLYKGSYALIIGEVNYIDPSWDDLTDVKNDIEAVKNVLKSQFSVETALDLTSQDLKNRISKFIDDYGYDADNRLLIYFAGHGYTLKSATGERERGYIVPVDVPDPVKDEVGFKRKAIDDDTLRNYAKQIESKHALFVFDSCFSGRLVSRGKINVPAVIEKSIEFPVREFITSGAANQPVPAVSDFRRAFVRGIEGDADANRDGFIIASELANYLREMIINLGKGQTPQYSKIQDMDLNRGEFVLLVKPKALPSPFERVRATAKTFLKYDEVFGSTEGLVLVRTDASYGYTGLDGQEAIPLKYDWANSFSEGLAAVSLEKKSKTDPETKIGFIDRSGKFVIPPEYDGAYSFKEGLAKVTKRDKVGFINKAGKTVISFIYENDPEECECGTDDLVYGTSKSYPSFTEGLTDVTLNQKKGFINPSGKVVVPIKYDVVLSFSEGLAGVSLNSKAGFVNKSGREVIPLIYEDVSPFSENLAPVKQNGKWGFIDKAGTVQIPPQYESAESFSGGVAKVELNQKTLFIDKTGKVRFQPDFYVSSFLNDIALGMSDIPFKYGFIDREGKKLIELRYDGLWCYAFVADGVFGVKLNQKKGFVDIYGNEYFDF